MRRTPFRLGLIYAATALVVAVATAVAFFPYDALEMRLDSLMRDRAGASLRLEDTGYSLPFGLGAEEATVRHLASDTAFKLSGVDVQWRPWALLSGGQRFVIHASSCGGGIRAVARFDSIFPGASGAGSLELRGVSLDECSRELSLGPVSDLSGRLEGEARGRDFEGGMAGMSGNASLRIEKGRIAFARGMLKGMAIEEARLECRLRLKGGTLRVSEARLDSPGMEASLKGELQLEDRLPRSGLDLQVELMFHPGRLASQPENSMVRQALARKGLSLDVKGTVASPRIRGR